MNPFPPEVRTASIVNRWSVVFTLNRDNVANHSFYVSLYSDAIAELIGWQGNRGDLLYYALTHDLEEVCTGDLVSPSKRAIIDFDRYNAYVTKQLAIKMPAVMDRLYKIETGSDAIAIEQIVAVADRLDALLFLVVERRMGNQHMEGRADDAQERLKEAWMRLPEPPNSADWKGAGNLDLRYLWEFVVVPSVNEHRNTGGSGV